MQKLLLLKSRNKHWTDKIDTAHALKFEKNKKVNIHLCLLSSDFHNGPAFNFLSRIHWPDALLLQEAEHCTLDSNTVFTLALSFNRLPPNEWKKSLLVDCRIRLTMSVFLSFVLTAPKPRRQRRQQRWRWWRPCCCPRCRPPIMTCCHFRMNVSSGWILIARPGHRPAAGRLGLLLLPLVGTLSEVSN